MYRIGVFQETVIGVQPLNIWECCDCGCQESIGSRAELAERSGNPDDAKVELHRPYIDEVTFKCKKLWWHNEESTGSY